MRIYVSNYPRNLGWRRPLTYRLSRYQTPQLATLCCSRQNQSPKPRFSATIGIMDRERSEFFIVVVYIFRFFFCSSGTINPHRVVMFHRVYLFLISFQRKRCVQRSRVEQLYFIRLFRSRYRRNRVCRTSMRYLRLCLSKYIHTAATVVFIFPLWRANWNAAESERKSRIRS